MNCRIAQSRIAQSRIGQSRITKLVAVPALALLAACGAEPEEAPIAEAPTTSGAQGEVLGGTISDEMLPLDTVQSQSPPLAGETDDADGDSEDSDAEDEQENEDDEAEAE